MARTRTSEKTNPAGPDNNELASVDQVIKKTGRGGKYNFPQCVEPEDPETVRAALGSVLYWRQRGLEDKPVTDDDIQNRVDEYLSTCWSTGQRMTVEKLALALGISRDTLHSWERGEVRSSRLSDIIKNAKDCIASYDAEMVTAGKMNPVPYIFRAKNYYGMKDQSDIVIEPKTSLTDKNPEEIVQEWEALPG